MAHILEVIMHRKPMPNGIVIAQQKRGGNGEDTAPLSRAARRRAAREAAKGGPK